jgi:hypothetical protein
MPNLNRRNIGSATGFTYKQILKNNLEHNYSDGPIQNEQTCEYIEDMALGLSQLAARIGQPVLAHFLTLVEEEARSAKNRGRLLSTAA